MSSFNPTEKPASAASCSISLPIFPYPTMAKFLGILCLRFAEKGARHLRVGIDSGKQFEFGNFFPGGMRHVNTARPEKKRFAPGRRKYRNIGSECNHRSRETVERCKVHCGQ